MPVEQLAQRVCNQKHAYTQFGGLRPFGVKFLFAGCGANAATLRRHDAKTPRRPKRARARSKAAGRARPHTRAATRMTPRRDDDDDDDDDAMRPSLVAPTRLFSSSSAGLAPRHVPRRRSVATSRGGGGDGDGGGAGSATPARYDKHLGFQLYQTDPSGNYGGWKAVAVGQNDGAGNSLLKNEYDPAATVEANLKLAIKVMGKTMDTTTPEPDKMEVRRAVARSGVRRAGRRSGSTPLSRRSRCRRTSTETTSLTNMSLRWVCCLLRRVVAWAPVCVYVFACVSDAAGQIFTLTRSEDGGFVHKTFSNEETAALIAEVAAAATPEGDV